MKRTLSELDSKNMLEAFGVPVAAHAVAADEKEAVREANKIGYPVVIKAYGAGLAHKTERGVVRTDLRSENDVVRACQEILNAAGADWEGFLIQPMIQGRREFVAGLFREEPFGPCVMFGLGGIFTEAIADVSFRIAPVSTAQAMEMMDELRSAALLGPFRGEARVDRDRLAEAITGLSRLAMERPDAAEADINPLIIGPDGSVQAVDALVALDPDGRDGDQDEDKGPGASAEDIRRALDVMTRARSVAVVGASRNRKGNFPGIFACMRNFGFSGNIYPINPKIGEINGIKAYPSLTALPEKVDLVIISVPARVVPDALEDCVASGNRHVHIFSSGFQESGEEEGIRLYDRIREIARKGDLHVIGPNCMGLYVPQNRMLTWVHAPKTAGPVSMISQSGGNAQEFTHFASKHYKVFFNKVISYGNALTLDSTDFLDYLARDPNTSMIAMYIEGVRDGRRLLELVSRTNPEKPVIIYKAGMTESGARAVSSHTGAMAGDRKLWDAFFRQTGAVRVESVEEMADAAAAFHYLKTTRGRRTAVLSVGGGAGVSVADTCSKMGMDVPALSAETIARIREFIPPEGNMLRNPIDSVLAFMNLELLGKIFGILSQSREIDNVVVSLPLDWLYDQETGGSRIDTIADYLAQNGRELLPGIPLVVVWRQFVDSDEIRSKADVLADILLEAGIPVFDGLRRAVGSLAKLAEYCEFCDGKGNSG